VLECIVVLIKRGRERKRNNNDVYSKGQLYTYLPKMIFPRNNKMKVTQSYKSQYMYRHLDHIIF
jgi:hypothetical protein